MKIENGSTYALVVARDAVRERYVHQLMRLGLPSGSFASAEEASWALNGDAPAIAVLEVEDGGCELLRELRDRYGPEVPVVLVSADRTTPTDVVAGLLVGADDYASESMDPDEFVARVRRLLNRSRTAETPPDDVQRLATLTMREREVLDLVSAGLSQKQVGSVLGISVKTVGTHVQSVLVKLGVHSRVEAVAIAVRAAAATS